jgi:hypothetical protein
MRLVAEPSEMSRTLPWPFARDEFPPPLGAVVQRTVLDGTMPALVVGHSSNGDWYVGDGVNDPNEPGAALATHIAHVIESNSSIGSLATLPPGHEATRRWPGDPWQVRRVELDDELDR